MSDPQFHPSGRPLKPRDRRGLIKADLERQLTRVVALVHRRPILIRVGAYGLGFLWVIGMVGELAGWVHYPDPVRVLFLTIIASSLFSLWALTIPGIVRSWEGWLALTLLLASLLLLIAPAIVSD